MSPRSPRRSIGPAMALALILALASALVITETIEYQRNTLYGNGRWTATKANLAKPVMGAAAFVTTRQALSGNVLNLGAWHGFHELVYDRLVDPEEVDIEFKLLPAAYLILEYDRRGGRFSGIRIGQDPRSGWMTFDASEDGEFLSQEPLAKRPMLRDDWNRLSVRLQPAEAVFSLNGQPLGTAPRKPNARLDSSATPPESRGSRIGVRGGADPVLVHDVVLHERGRSTTETFRNTRDYGWILASTIAILLLTGGLFHLVTSDPKKGLYAYILALLVLTVIAASFHLLDFLYLSAMYPVTSAQINRWLKIDDLREFKRRPSWQDIERDMAKSVVDDGAYRVLILGSSQTWGEGSSRDEDAFPAQTDRLMKASGSSAVKARVSVINGGLWGIRSSALLDEYREHMLVLRPDAVVINLSNNDALAVDRSTNDAGAFRATLNDFVDLDASRGIRTVFMLEPNSSERRQQHLADNHAIMRDVARIRGVPVIEVEDYLTASANRGFLWWDEVHMTSFGLRLTAERVAAELQRILFDDRAGPVP